MFMTMDFRTCHRGLNEIFLLIERCTQLQELDIHGCKGISDYGIQTIASNCKAITSINISDCESLTGYHFWKMQ